MHRELDNVCSECLTPITDLAPDSTRMSQAQYFLVSTLVGDGDLVRLFSGDLVRFSGDRDRLSLEADLICCRCISWLALGSPRYILASG